MAKAKQEFATLDAIKKSHGPRFRSVDIPEWGEDGKPAKVLVKRLGAPEYIAINESRPPGKLQGQAAYDYFLKIVQASLVNPDGSRLIDDGHIYLLADYPSLVTRLGAELLELNGLIGGRPKNSVSTS